jgi:hypothetical protein
MGPHCLSQYWRERRLVHLRALLGLPVDSGPHELDPDTAVISGSFATDNDGDIRLNGGAALATTSFAGFGPVLPLIAGGLLAFSLIRRKVNFSR